MPDNRKASGAQHGLTALLALVASTVLSVAAADGGKSWLAIAAGVSVHSALVMSGMAYFRRQSRGLSEPPPVHGLALAVILLSIGFEPVLRILFYIGRPFELIAMETFRYLSLLLAAAGCWNRYQRLAAASSLFVTIFAACLTTSPSVHLLTAAFGVVGIAWLTSSYWGTQRGPVVRQSESRAPIGWWLAASLAVVALVTTVGVGRNTMLRSVRGFLPSSGGDGEFSPYARSGVNDGDAVVPGSEDVKSFAPIDDAPFLQDDKPALFDVWSEEYDEPIKKIKQDRAVSLPPAMASEVEKRLARSKQAGREFSTVRKQRQKSGRIGDLDTDALFFVAGRTPLHLRLRVFDLFDGTRWHEEPCPEQVRTLKCVTANGRPWIRFPASRTMERLFGDAESHAVKPAKFDTNRIPTPLQLRGIHIRDVDRADMFGWAQRDIVKMNRKRLQPMIPIHLASQPIDTAEFTEEGGRYFSYQSFQQYNSLPPLPQIERIRRLAKEWTQGVPRGWKQIQRVTEKLKERCERDRDAPVPPEAVCPVGHFLFVSRRGPDYLFATSAALMLRSLGYSTRVVSGFYVHPEKYDSRSRHTPVHKSDVHFWVEVFVGANVWITVEPTPGYEVLGPPPNWWERILGGVTAALRFATDHIVALLALAAMLIVGYRYRFVLYDYRDRLVWRLTRRTGHRLVLKSWWLLERRLHRAGIGRPVSLTPLQWCRQLRLTDDPEQGRQLATLLRCVDESLFGAGSPPGAESVESAIDAVRRWTPAKFQAVALRWRPPTGRIPWRARIRALISFRKPGTETC